MKHQRNLKGLEESAQRRHQQTIAKTDQAIKQLIKEGEPINFESVAKVANVSKAWLYKHEDTKARIEHLRDQGAGKKRQPSTQKTSDASKDAIIRTLKERIKKLEEKCQKLGRQNEVFGEQVLRVRELERLNQRLQSENAALRQQLGVSMETNAATLSRSSVELELEKLGVQLNPTIQKVLREAPSDMVAMALDALREACLEDRVDNPSGFFHQAVKEAWKPNDAYEQSVEQNTFKIWFPVAQQAGLAKASTESEGVLCILTADEQWVAFDEMLKLHPLETLQRRDSELQEG